MSFLCWQCLLKRNDIDGNPYGSLINMNVLRPSLSITIHNQALGSQHLRHMNLVDEPIASRFYLRHP